MPNYSIIVTQNSSSISYIDTHLLTAVKTELTSAEL